MADDALSVDVRSVTPTMKAITFPKNAASAHPANHLRTVAMMFTALSEKQSENGHPSPFLRLSLPDAEPLKDIPKDFVGGDFTEDGGEVVEGLAEVFGEEVGGLGGG